MRILLVHNKYKYRGGEDSVFHAEHQLLQKAGHDVQTLLFDNRSIQTIKQKLTLGFKSLYNTQSKSQLGKVIADFNPQIIHIHNLFYIASPSILYEAQKTSIPVVMTLHNYRLICSGALLFRDNRPCLSCINSDLPLKGIIYKCYNNSLIQSTQITLTTGIHKKLGTWKNHVDKFIALTEFAKSIFEKSSLNVSQDQLTIKPNFVEDYGISEEGARNDHYLFVGRLTEEKGINVVLNAFENSTHRLEIVGDGPLKTLVEAKSTSHKNIIYHGLREKDFVIEKLKSCKALIFPSMWFEGLPIIILEAFSTGTPVIASDIDNINTIISNGNNGLHFKTGNHEDLLEKLSKFGDEKSHSNLYTNARNTYENLYHPDANYKKLMQIYNDAINAKKKNHSA